MGKFQFNVKLAFSRLGRCPLENFAETRLYAFGSILWDAVAVEKGNI